MKRHICFFVILVACGMFALLPVEARSGWVLYDNFNAGMIDPTLWDIDDSCANISVVDGHLRFEHLPGYPGDPSSLLFKQNPESIKAVKVTVMVQSCTGDVHARIGGRIGQDQEGNTIFKRIAVRDARSHIDSWAGVNELYDLYFATFKWPIDILRKVFTIAMDFDRQSLASWAQGFGKNVFTPEQPILPYTPPSYKQIGTWSPNGDGPAIVWFDNVYVMY